MLRPYTDKDKEKLQKYLAVIRKVAGWTSEDLGEMIGVTKQTISNIENNRSSMTKTQYIAIRAMIDYEISKSEENSTLSQVVNILLDSEDPSDEDQVKIDTTVAYVTGAKEKGMSSSAISVGLATLITALGIIAGPVSSAAAASVTAPLWVEAISQIKKKKN